MTITTFAVGAAVTPTVVRTYVSHYANRKTRQQKPTAHISYDEGLNLVRSFLEYASHKTVEELQAFTAQWVPHPSWVRIENVTIPPEFLSKAADHIIENLGPNGVNQIGGSQWWQWRRPGSDMRAEWIEMKADYNEHKRTNTRSKRVILYNHGGGYFFGSVDEHRYQLQRHARKLNARVLAPRYRLAPQFPFPCGLQDCLAVYLYLLTIHDPTEIIIAGDSAGGGMAVSILCILRDCGLPLPAGAILISPWVDLTHSFPSVSTKTDFDYIPPHGFQQKPSSSWPPPNDDDLAAIATSAIGKVAGQSLPRKSRQEARKSAEAEAVQGFAVLSSGGNKEELARQNPNNPAGPNDPNPRAGDTVPGPEHQLSIEIDGKLVIVKDQIQMYTTNRLTSHPLVSPVLQPSLGGLPPLLVLTGGGEVLRDEQIYLAHKAANPSKYPLGEIYRSKYDPDDTILKKYRPTPVQLQVWEDLCHVAPTLSFTRPAKFMYRSIAQFGAWALARAQNTTIEIVDDDEISFISSRSSSDIGTNESTDSFGRHQSKLNQTSGSVGKAGDPLPPFKNHMIRQHVDRHGHIFQLPLAQDLPATRMDPDQVGVIKPVPVRKWMEAKQQWDTKYAQIKRNVQKQRAKELAEGDTIAFGSGENPPPSALAGRRSKKEMEERRQRKSYGLAMWSGWGSKHDKHTIKREEEAISRERRGSVTAYSDGDLSDQKPGDLRTRSASENRARRLSTSKGKNANDRSRSRRRTITVADQGQIERNGRTEEIPDVPALAFNSNAPTPADSSSRTENLSDVANQKEALLSPMFIPKFKTAAHLRNDGGDHSDTASVRTGNSYLLPDNASTRAVIGAAGLSRNLDSSDLSRSKTVETPTTTGDCDNIRNFETNSTTDSGRHYPHGRGTDTPASRRSVERLQSHQAAGDDSQETQSQLLDGASGHLAPPVRIQPVRSPSNTAIVHSEGVVDVVAGGNQDPMSPTLERNPSSMAIKHADGVVDVVEGGVADPTSPECEIKHGNPMGNVNTFEHQTKAEGMDMSRTVQQSGEIENGQSNPDAPDLSRPGLYDRSNTEFQTAAEKLY